MKQTNKTRLVLISSVVAMTVMLAVGTTLAFLHTNSQNMTNAFTPGVVSIDTEENSSTPDSSNDIPYDENGAKKEVKIQNNGTVDAYVRVKLVPSWKYEQTGSHVTADIGSFQLDGPVLKGNTLVYGEGEVTLVLAENWQENWIYVDGTFYHKSPVKAGETSALLLKEVKVKDMADFEDLQVDVLSEAIQTTDGEGQRALIEAWGDTLTFTFAADGKTIVSIQQK